MNIKKIYYILGLSGIIFSCQMYKDRSYKTQDSLIPSKVLNAEYFIQSALTPLDISDYIFDKKSLKKEEIFFKCYNEFLNRCSIDYRDFSLLTPPPYYQNFVDRGLNYYNVVFYVRFHNQSNIDMATRGSVEIRKIWIPDKYSPINRYPDYIFKVHRTKLHLYKNIVKSPGKFEEYGLVKKENPYYDVVNLIHVKLIQLFLKNNIKVNCFNTPPREPLYCLKDSR